MSIRIVAARYSTPDSDGYPDTVQFEHADTGEVLMRFLRFRTNPNRLNPHNGKNWRECYGQIMPGIYRYACIASPKHGKCLALNGLAAIPTTLPNYNPETQYPGTNSAEDVEIHCGQDNSLYPGSAACQLFPPDEWETAIGYFSLGDVGEYVLSEPQEEL
jgi:hypothetical protein